jgi:predicted permease
MESVSVILGSVAPVFALIGLGFVCGRKNLLGDNAFEVLNRFVLIFALPVLTFNVLAGADPARLGEPVMFIAVMGGATIVYVLSFGIDRLLRRPAADSNIIAMAGSFPNTSLIGLPICLLAFGPASLPTAAIVIALYASLGFGIPLVISELAAAGRTSLPIALGHAARALALNPMIQASVLGILWSVTRAPFPAPLKTLAETLGGATAACALVSIGLFIARPQPRAAPATMGRVLLFKLVGQPLVTFGLFHLLPPVPPLWSKTAILLSAMPTGTSAFVLAAQGSALGSALIARAIILSTLAALVTLSAILFLMA